MASHEETIDKNLTPLKFHFFRIRFTPYSSVKNHNSHTIISEIMKYLTKQKVEGKGFLIDKHETRAKEIARPLFATGMIFLPIEKRYSCSMALLRTGKMPMLKPAEKYILIPLDKSTGEIAEQTHFFIDYSSDEVIMCVEYNHEGPRASDIEYYFRIVARDKLNLAKATEMEMIMDTSLDKVLGELKNVLNFEVKVQPEKLAQLDTALVGQYFTGLTTLGNRIKPKFLRLEAFFQSPGRQIASSELNRGANTMATQFLQAFKARPTNMDVFDHFYIKYEDKNGKEDFYNLVKGKKEVIKYVDFKTLKGRQFYELIEGDLTEFIQKIKNA